MSSFQSAKGMTAVQEINTRISDLRMWRALYTAIVTDCDSTLSPPSSVLFYKSNWTLCSVEVTGNTASLYVTIAYIHL
jgi:hypothetical protein